MEQSRPKSKLILLESDAVTATRFARVASRIYEVVIARDAKEAVSQVTSDPSVHVFVAGATGQPAQSAASVLERVKSARPDALRVSFTEPSELGAVIAGLHSGVIERTIQKPVDVEGILAAITPPSRLATLAAGCATPAKHAR